MAEQSKSSQKTSGSNPSDTNTAKSPPSPPIALRKSSSMKRQNCLCSPTTHAGSFRCRYHRNAGLARSGMSVGSKLSELAGESSLMCDNMQQLLAAHRHSCSSSTYLPA